MTLNLSVSEKEDLKPRITVFGVGGAGGNAVNNMIEKQLKGVDFVVANTDAQALQQSQSSNKLQLGVKVTEGLGAGARASIGASAAEESIEQIVDELSGTHMCFITAGMGGGTGTGAAPIIAQAARELGVLTVGVVTKPFQFEGIKRMRQADEGVEALQKMVDTLIIIPNQNLFRIANEKTTFTEAFSMADDVLYQGVKGVTDLMVRPGLINLDFADVRAVMDEMGKAMMGTGEAEGEDRAVQASEKAIANPLLDEISLRGAKGVLINITGGYDLTLFELDEAANRIREEVDPNANIIVGSTLDTELEGKMRVSVVATGIEAEQILQSSSINTAETSVLAVEEVAESTDQNLSFEEPIVAETQAIFEEVDNEILANREFDQSLVKESDGLVASSQRDVSLDSQSSSPGIPSADTLARLRAAVTKGTNEKNKSQISDEQSETERPKFGISSLINRMSRSESSSVVSGVGRKEPNFNSEAVEERDFDDLEQDKIEVPAFLRRQAN
jgi:cell division protein FtsZ|tara:strand:+ start:6126 stop:7634 length:1509 start_codon:yes stop_codon:yes gene_type:complete